MVKIGHWFVVVVIVHVNSALMNDVVLTAIYEYHMDRTYEFIGPDTCT